MLLWFRGDHESVSEFLIPQLKCIASGSSAPFAFQSARHEDDVVMNVLKNVFQSFANFSR